MPYPPPPFRWGACLRLSAACCFTTTPVVSLFHFITASAGVEHKPQITNMHRQSVQVHYSMPNKHLLKDKKAWFEVLYTTISTVTIQQSRSIH